MYLEDIAVGTRIDVDNIVIDRDEMLDFSRKYDPAQIHIDEEYAKTTRFGRLIAPGMLTFLKFWEKYLPLDPAGEELIAGSSTSVTWSAPVFAGDILHGTATVTDITFRNDYNGFMTVSVNMYDSGGKPVLEAQVVSVVKRGKPE